MLTIATSLVPSLNIVPGGRPAVVSLRICRDRYGRHYVDHRSRQLIYYVSRHQRRW